MDHVATALIYTILGIVVTVCCLLSIFIVPLAIILLVTVDLFCNQRK